MFHSGRMDGEGWIWGPRSFSADMHTLQSKRKNGVRGANCGTLPTRPLYLNIRLLIQTIGPFPPNLFPFNRPPGQGVGGRAQIGMANDGEESKTNTKCYVERFVKKKIREKPVIIN